MNHPSIIEDMSEQVLVNSIFNSDTKIISMALAQLLNPNIVTIKRINLILSFLGTDISNINRFQVCAVLV